MSPADSRTTSPGTNISIGISVKSTCPLELGRLTVAVVFTIARSRAAASFDRCSWTNAVMIDRKTMMIMTEAARRSPRK